MPEIQDKLKVLDAIQEGLEAYNRRTPAEIAAVRARLFAQSRPARPLPPGKTREDVIVGQWPGDETDEEIEAALAELS